MNSTTVTPWAEMGKDYEDELAKALYEKGIVTFTTAQAPRYIQARKGPQVTQKGRPKQHIFPLIQDNYARCFRFRPLMTMDGYYYYKK